MSEFDVFGNGVSAEEDPAAAFLAQQESEIAGIENDDGFSILDSGEVPMSLHDGAVGECGGMGMTGGVTMVDRSVSPTPCLTLGGTGMLRYHFIDANPSIGLTVCDSR